MTMNMLRQKELSKEVSKLFLILQIFLSIKFQGIKILLTGRGTWPSAYHEIGYIDWRRG